MFSRCEIEGRAKMRLKGKVAIVTGAAGGIGRASAILFAAEGARVTAVDVKKEALSETVTLIEKAGGEGRLSITDVGDEEQVKTAVDETVAQWGRADILFNNAGIVLVKFLEETTESEWDRVMDVNLKSIFLGVKHTVPHMRRQGGGVILSTASINSLGGQFKTPAYVASKGAVLALTKSLAMDYGADNIRVNCICPGITYTPMLQEHLEASGDPEGVLKQRLTRVPLGRVLTPEDIARGALYLVSDESKGVTGIAHVVDGGITSGFEYDRAWTQTSATE
jgi:NAD(P)-dependent dehydrogenase (short-subunit alcohol dehydrogenase family)